MIGGPRIKQFDDVPWMEVGAIRLRDGRIARIREKWFELTPRYVCFYNEWDPGAMTPPHGHTGDHGIFIIEGSISSGSLVANTGANIMLEWGDIFGPWTAGPEGCKMYGFTTGDGKPYFDQPRWQAFLAEQGAEELPVPSPMHLMPLFATYSGSILPKIEGQ